LPSDAEAALGAPPQAGLSAGRDAAGCVDAEGLHRLIDL
jgi:hypothetical protein